MQNVNGGIWDKLTKLVVFLIILSFALLVVVWLLPGTKQKQRMLRDIQNSEIQSKKEEAIRKALTASINALRDDPKTVERLARDKFSYAKPGETVVRFEDLTTNSVAPRQ
jgi:cell division protein FtsB